MGLLGGREKEQIQVFILKAQPVSSSLSGVDGAGSPWGAQFGALFSLGVGATFC